MARRIPADRLASAPNIVLACQRQGRAGVLELTGGRVVGGVAGKWGRLANLGLDLFFRLQTDTMGSIGPALSTQLNLRECAIARAAVGFLLLLFSPAVNVYAPLDCP
jgi:hypothetical protein